MWKVILAAATLMATFVSGVRAENWIYADQFMLKREHAIAARDTVQIQTAPYPSVIIGDVGDHATFCTTDSEYICVDAKSFKFYVPRAFSSGVGEWNSGGSKYKLIGKDTVRILGREYRISYIETVTDDATIRYLYSASHGLLGFSVHVSENQPKTYLLEGKIGFGAIKARRAQ